MDEIKEEKWKGNACKATSLKNQKEDYDDKLNDGSTNQKGQVGHVHKGHFWRFREKRRSCRTHTQFIHSKNENRKTCNNHLK